MNKNSKDMCLKTRAIEPLIAEEDIKVYKVLRRETTLNGNEYYVAPFYKYYKYNKGYNFPIRLEGKNYGPYNSIVGTISVYNYKYGDDAFVGRGWLHAYATKNIPLKDYDLTDTFITEMIIPKCARYYLSNDKKEICSEVLMWHDF